MNVSCNSTTSLIAFLYVNSEEIFSDLDCQMYFHTKLTLIKMVILSHEFDINVDVLQ